jgi:aerobic-type carbon monoxide dehydrogenase small subunit (CoxS/CutS family)
MDRRDFLKASAAGAITVGGVVAGLVTAPPRGASPLALPAPVTHETSGFIVNGKAIEMEHEVRTTLWEVLSEKSGLTGTVRACDRGTCGVCTVLVDDTPYYSCHILASDVAGKRISTIEGLSDGTKLDPIQEIAIRNMALDCGFCTAGWVPVAKSFVAKNNNPTDAQIKKALSGHLCRCAAYGGIVRTVKDYAALVRGEAVL